MDAILYWNDVALEANKESHTNGLNENTGPTLSSRALAIVHLAMHDAYFGIVTGIYPTYASGLPTPAAEAAPDAAIAAAAYFTLAQLYPRQKAMLDAKLASAPGGRSIAMTCGAPSWGFASTTAVQNRLAWSTRILPKTVIRSGCRWGRRDRIPVTRALRRLFLPTRPDTRRSVPQPFR